MTKDGACACQINPSSVCRPASIGYVFLDKPLVAPSHRPLILS